MTHRAGFRRTLLACAGLGAAGTGLAGARLALAGPDLWLGPGLLCAFTGLLALYWATARIEADAHGLRSRTLLRRWSVPWHEVADLRVFVNEAPAPQTQDRRRVDAALRGGRRRRLPQPRSRITPDPDFDARLAALRALHSRHGAPESDHLPVVSHRTAGFGPAWRIVAGVLLLAGAGTAAWFVPAAASQERAWRSAVPCAEETPAAERAECLTTVGAVIERTEADRSRGGDRLYFAGGAPVEQVTVPYETARAFEPGDRVEVTLWRGEVRGVVGDGHAFRDHVTGAGDVAVVAAACALAAGWPAARLLLRLRARGLPDDEVVPSALPFAGALVGTALWLLPLCYLHPMDQLGSPATAAWTAAGSSASLALFAMAWRATRVRAPGEAAGARRGAAPAGDGADGREEDVFVAARFLEATDYNPYHFGTHVVLGGEGPAVTPHAGPGRFAAKRIPVERLTLTTVRRGRGGDGGVVPKSWHVAEFDDAGTPVRLAAAPADLVRVLDALTAARRTAGTPAAD
ncbi:PH domain-containing protein [Streptomyces marincola]|nr:PH domain-containing protein [Streptomyces marincola]UCM91797.1 PH domain-containing protein [Streptomyces marincola]